MSGQELIPFGKYRGMPVDAVIEDREYTDWLMDQAWFRERYQNLYVTIQNGGAQSDMTPEHNRMQARFLDKDYVKSVIKSVVMRTRYKSQSDSVLSSIKFDRIGFEVDGWDVVVPASIKVTYSQHDSPPEIESESFLFLFELKPAISDDFPAVLRQVKSRRKRIDRRKIEVVICDSFDVFSSVPFDSVRRMFALSEILLLQSNQLE